MKTVDEILKRILNYSEIDKDLSVDNCPDWNSMAQIQLIVELEDEYNISISGDEAMNMDSVKAIKEILSEKGITGHE